MRTYHYYYIYTTSFLEAYAAQSTMNITLLLPLISQLVSVCVAHPVVVCAYVRSYVRSSAVYVGTYVYLSLSLSGHCLNCFFFKLS